MTVTITRNPGIFSFDHNHVVFFQHGLEHVFKFSLEEFAVGILRKRRSQSDRLILVKRFCQWDHGASAAG